MKIKTELTKEITCHPIKLRIKNLKYYSAKTFGINAAKKSATLRFSAGIVTFSKTQILFGKFDAPLGNSFCCWCSTKETKTEPNSDSHSNFRMFKASSYPSTAYFQLDEMRSIFYPPHDALRKSCKNIFMSQTAG